MSSLKREGESYEIRVCRSFWAGRLIPETEQGMKGASSPLKCKRNSSPNASHADPGRQEACLCAKILGEGGRR